MGNDVKIYQGWAIKRSLRVGEFIREYWCNTGTSEDEEKAEEKRWTDWEEHA